MVTVDGAVEGLPVITDPVGVVGDIIRIGELRTDGWKQKAEIIVRTGFCQQREVAAVELKENKTADATSVRVICFFIIISVSCIKVFRV